MNPGDRVRATEAYAKRLKMCGVDAGHIKARRKGGVVDKVDAAGVHWTLTDAPVCADKSVGVRTQLDVASDLEVMP